MDLSDRRKRAAAEAAQWWVTLQGEVSRSHSQQYVEWLRESPLHIAEMLRVAQVHGALNQFKRWALLATDNSTAHADHSSIVVFPRREPDHRGAPRGPEHSTARRRYMLPVAATLVVTIGATLAWVLSTRGQVIETDRGERREVALADGSLVQVDPETRLRLKYEANVRRVLLDRGRVLFHVARNPNRPFVVEAQGTDVRAVGTAFAVERDASSIVVTVAEGQVAVLDSKVTREREAARNDATTGPARGSGKSAPTAGSATGLPARLLLSANEQVTVDRSGTAQPVHVVDSGQELAWANGKLIFRHDTVLSVIQQFNRYNRIQLSVKDAALAGQPINGVFDAADPDSFIAFIQSVTAVKVVRDDLGNVAIEAAE